jgi:hypothetical protein
MQNLDLKKNKRHKCKIRAVWEWELEGVGKEKGRVKRP